MATNTEHYNLVKPDYTDAADVAQLNDNMDIIDSILWQLANAGADEELLKKVQEILDKIGETDDTGGSTTLGSVMAKLNEILKKAGSGTTGKTIIQILEELLQQPKIIKHIQTGDIQSSSGNPTKISLAGFTNLEKMIFWVEGYISASDTVTNIYGSGLTLTSLNITGYSTKSKRGSYKVVEFY